MVSYRRYWLNNAVVHIFESIQLLGVGGSLRDEPHWGLSMAPIFQNNKIYLFNCKMYIRASWKKTFTSFREFRFSLGWGEAWGMRLINDTHRKFREALEELFYRLVSGDSMVFGGQQHTLLHQENGPQSFNCLIGIFLPFRWHFTTLTSGCLRVSTRKLLLPDNFVYC